MSAQAAIAEVLARLSDAHICDLADACERAAEPPVTLSASVAGAPPASVEAVSALRVAWDSTPGLTGAGVALALRTGLAARQAADQRRARPVWTGPGAAGEQRLTPGVIHELLAEARERILLVSFAAFTLPEVAADLEAAAKRGCGVDVVFETADDNDAYRGPSRPFAEIPGLQRWRWPQDKRPPSAALHAKLLVVDGRRALVGSANLTHKALNANMEAGVVISDEQLASALERHLRELMASGVFTQIAMHSRASSNK